MTEAEKLEEKFAAARWHPNYTTAMATPPVTWLKVATIVVVGMCVSIVLTLKWYPWRDLERMPGGIKAIMMFSWIPTIGALIGSVWLFFDALGLSTGQTRYELAVLTPQIDGPAPYSIRVVTPGGIEHTYRAKRRAASVAKLRLLVPGEVGVAVLKGDICVEWVALPPTPGRVYDRS
jgi:hypothetical protein